MPGDFPVLGLICARGGSKGVPRKNIKEFCGKPLIAWSIECALQCPDIDDVVVSTEDAQIAEIAQKYGAEVPFMRPPELAEDKSKQIDAIIHAINSLKEQGREYKAVALLQPTCPLRQPEDVSDCIDLMKKTHADTVITVLEEEGVILSTLYEMDDQSAVKPMFDAPGGGTLRQDYKPIYRRSGSVYLLNAEYICKHGALYGDKVCAHVVPKERAFDIDTPFDWDLASAWIQRSGKT